MTDIFYGLPASPGIGIGTLFIYRTHRFDMHSVTIEHTEKPEQEWEQFLTAKAQVAEELVTLGGVDDSLVAEVFTAQQVILEDHTLIQAIEQAIFAEKQSAVSATHYVICELAEIFRNLGDDYFAGRSVDIIDIGHRLMTQMGGSLAGTQQLRTIPAQSILVATELIPSELTQLPLEHVIGIALADSTPTAHSAILARTLGIPMVCTLGEAILTLPSTLAVLDGETGTFLVQPGPNELSRYQTIQHAQAAQLESAIAHAQRSADTEDGVRITVLANINSSEEITEVTTAGADGVGLLRTEYLFQNRLTSPSLEEQYETYLTLAHQFDGRRLTVRALDAGGDKPMQYIHHQHEENPFLGLRGIRLLLDQPELLCTQFRALYRVAVALEDSLEVRFMLPMISSVDETREARGLLNEVVAQECVAHPPLQRPMQIGAMIEVPSAALVAHRIANYVDFLSIGTNDLAQYVLATDRTNASVAALADPLHPAVLKLVKLTCEAANQAHIPVSICGEVSGDPHAVPLLVGLGLRELSVPLPAVPLVKAAVRTCTLATASMLATQALECDDAHDVRQLLSSALQFNG